MTTLERAIEVIEDDRVKLSDKISTLRDALVEEAFALLKLSAKGKEDDARKDRYTEMAKYLKALETMFFGEQKMNKATGQGQGKRDLSFLGRIKKMPDTQSDIIKAI